MGVMTNIASMFTFQRDVTIADYFSSSEETIRKSIAQKLWDYYSGDRDEIIKHLERALSLTFDAEEIAEKQKPYMLFVRRIIDRLCRTYLKAPERYVLGDESANELYQEILTNSNINKAAKTWHRLARLHDVVLVSPVWRNDHIEFDIYQPYQCSVIPDGSNYLNMKEIIYMMTVDGVERYIYWSDDEHYMMDKDGKRITMEGNPSGVNPYGILPFSILRMRETEGFWGTGDRELIDINEQVNVLLVNSCDNAIMQAHGQPFAVNCNIKGKIKTGARHIIQVNDIGSDFASPSFSFVQPQSAIEDTMKQIDWMVKTVAINRGLPGFSMSSDASVESGASKGMDALELFEIGIDDQDILRPFEKDLFYRTISVWNYHSGKKINEKAIFSIDFEDLEMPRTEEEEMWVKKEKLQLGLWTPVDDMVDEDEGIDRDAAMQLITENLEIRNALQDQYGIMTIAKQNNAVQETSSVTTDDAAGLQ